jgi:hypothetical protein
MKSRVTCRGPGRDLKGRSEYLRLGIFPLVGMRRRSAWTFFLFFRHFLVRRDSGHGRAATSLISRQVGRKVQPGENEPRRTDYLGRVLFQRAITTTITIHISRWSMHHAALFG